MLNKSEYTVVKGTLAAVVLAIIQENPSCGYAIIKEIRKRHGIYLGPSTVYPMLGELQRRKLLVSEWIMTYVRPKKVYTITKAGISELQTMSVQISVLFREVTKTINMTVQ